MESLKLPKRLSRKNVYSSEWVDLNLDKVRLSSGKIIENYHMLEAKFDSVVVLMTNSKNEICFVKSPRYTTQTIEIELPSGGISPGESIESAGKRELLEETGYILSKPQHVYSFYPSNSISNQKSHIVIGKCNENEVVKDFDHDEVNEVLWLSNNQILEHIQNKQIMDGYALIAILYYFYIIK